MPEDNLSQNLSIDFQNNLVQYENEVQIKAVSNESFGEQHLFWIPLPDWIQMRATLLAVGNYCYVYMANETIDLLGENNSISKCNSIRDAFDDDVYPKAIEVAGHPNGILGDIDGDPHVTIFLAPTVRYMGTGYLGFMYLENEDPGFPYTNLREMVYCDSEKNVYETICITIHEFNHLIWYNNDWNDADFINEGLANYAIDYAEYYFWVTTAVTNAFTYYPEISLLYFNRFYGSLWDASYGQAYLFVTYLANRFGNNFTKELVFIPEDGTVAIDVALDRFGYNLTFNDLYLDWITACVLDNSDIYEGIYGFESVSYTIQAQTAILFDFEMTRTHYFYGFDVKRMYVPRDSFTFKIDNPYPYALGVSLVIKDDNNWTVTQTIYHEDTDKIQIYVEGININNVYVITSLMSPDTPTGFGDVFSLDELISSELTYNFFEGNAVTDEVENTSPYFLFIPMLASLLIVKKRKKLSITE
ncbi:MAG TPA: hypothetical protein VMZ29_10865 [Candidatus Bathyarchaeia archaeon]|nr:hypothetical protein [Candidatus Bathyarchaeia archaeon]